MPQINPSYSWAGLIILMAMLLWTRVALAYEGKVIDAATSLPIEAAVVTVGNQAVRTDKDGAFRLEASGETLKLRAAGYAKLELADGSIANLALSPFTVRGLYLTVYGIASAKLRGAALKTVENNHLNALVIDVKGDWGFIPFKIDLPLAERIGAQDTILIKDMNALMASLKEKNLYLIARIVVFKDDLLARARPDLAVRKKGGGIYTDRENLRWVEPFSQEVWDYNIAIAKKVAELGFDEVQFDYTRFPDTHGGAFSKPCTEASRTDCITDFLETAYLALTPYNVMVAADIFGYVPWK